MITNYQALHEPRRRVTESGSSHFALFAQLLGELVRAGGALKIARQVDLKIKGRDEGWIILWAPSDAGAQPLGKLAANFKDGQLWYNTWGTVLPFLKK